MLETILMVVLSFFVLLAILDTIRDNKIQKAKKHCEEHGHDFGYVSRRVYVHGRYCAVEQVKQAQRKCKCCGHVEEDEPWIEFGIGDSIRSMSASQSWWDELDEKGYVDEQFLGWVENKDDIERLDYDRNKRLEREAA